MFINYIMGGDVNIFVCVDLVERGMLTIVGEIGAIKMAAVIIIIIINIYIIIIYWGKGVLPI